MPQQRRLYLSGQDLSDEKVAPLNKATFLQRLKDLEESVKSLAELKAVMDRARDRR